MPKVTSVVSGQPIASAWGNAVATELNRQQSYTYLTGDTQPANGAGYITLVGAGGTSFPQIAGQEGHNWVVLINLQNHPGPPYTNSIGYIRMLVNGSSVGEYGIPVPLVNTLAPMVHFAFGVQITSVAVQISNWLSVAGRVTWIDGRMP